MYYFKMIGTLLYTEMCLFKSYNIAQHTPWLKHFFSFLIELHTYLKILHIISLELNTMTYCWIVKDMHELTVHVCSRTSNIYIYFFLNRFLNIFLGECKSVLTTKLQCTNKKAEENRKLLQRLSKDLETIEKTRKKVNKIKGN